MPLDPKSVPPDGGASPTPAWRKHFPIDATAEAARSRRDFIGGLTIAGGAIAAGQAGLKQLSPQNATDSDDNLAAKPMAKNAPLVLEKNLSALQDGEAFLFHYPNDRTPCLLIRLGESEAVAFEQKCTHLCCPVIPDADAGQFHCPCHHGAFDLKTGEPLAGPPRRPLPQLTVTIADDGRLTVQS